MSKDELLTAAIAAAKSGNLSQAAELFMQVVKIDPACEQGWLGLGYSLSAPDRREYCFRRVLAINPDNRVAKAELARLSKPAAPPAPVPAPARQSPLSKAAMLPGRWNLSLRCAPPRRSQFQKWKRPRSGGNQLPQPLRQQPPKWPGQSQSSRKRRNQTCRWWLPLSLRLRSSCSEVLSGSDMQFSVGAGLQALLQTRLRLPPNRELSRRLPLPAQHSSRPRPFPARCPQSFTHRSMKSRPAPLTLPTHRSTADI